MIRVKHDLVIEIPKESARNEQVILEDASIKAPLRPMIRTLTAEVPRPSLSHQVGDSERLMSSLAARRQKEVSMGLYALRRLSSVLKIGDSLRLVLRRNEVLDVLPEAEEKIYGVAVDIGTTTVVAYLMDLSIGECVSVHSRMNPQISHGDDVISRITFALSNKEGASILQTQMSQCVDELITQCCLSASVPKERIYETVVVGNTAMHHLFFGLDTSNLGRCPFVPVLAEPIEVKASELGIRTGKESYVYSLPNVAGFVGADHVGVLVTCRLWESDKPKMAIDIGTNGEISVGNTGGISSTSCAAGPALEGANIKFGMRATTGAIDHLTISKGFEVKYSTINKGRAKGFCGSAIVDAVSEMFRVGIIGAKGDIRKDSDTERVRTVKGETYFVVATREESATGKPVYITQKDIGEVQCAKAAMYAGATILMEDMGITQKDLESILLAGAFGNYIAPRSAIGLGIFPEVPISKVKQIGNAAGSGAKIALLDEQSRLEAKELARRIRFVELAVRPEFQDRFFRALYIPHRDPSLFPGVMSRVAEINRAEAECQ
jgi:uncharacterized 2Fe-2S/4Fe-4S cluster protein (DUF4445 family)